MEMIKPKITYEENTEKGNYAKFVIEPLERGYGTTLGNSLRRFLLSALPGAAPVGIQIAGVDHEFSTIKGVREDVTEIILNIKGLAVKITDSKELLISIQFTYTEIDDGKEEDKFDISASFNLDLDSLSPKEIIDLIVQGKINIKDLGDINIEIDGKEVWVEAFLDEID